AALTAAFADGSQPCPPERAAALRDYVLPLLAGIHHHHAMEDQVLWPVLARSAGAQVDLNELSDDHASLDPLLDQARTALLAAVADPGDPAAFTDLARLLATLRDLLDEHIEEEERLLFPVIARHVPVADWLTVERAVRKGGALRFEVPRIEHYARPEELAALLAAAGPVLRLMLRLLRPGFQRRQRLLFG
ncbi:hemerythrin domain-containing protein, partial [Catellatospora methionotrophica]|uniref:hemerythrin domain-containing protein n=1 Tax=Catellatospora methionotrophica TaxID=121620 RepID=UPI0033C3FFD2